MKFIRRDRRFHVGGTKPSWTPATGDGWFRANPVAGVEEKQFVYDGTRWIALEAIRLAGNRGGTPSGNQYVGVHRISAFNASGKSWRFPFTVQVYRMYIDASGTPANDNSVRLMIDSSNEHELSWNGLTTYATSVPDKLVAVNTPISLRMMITSGSPSAPDWRAYILCREYVA
jgi:hypothetical protein